MQNTVELSFSEYRIQLLKLAQNNLNPVLAKRVTAEDVVQETLLSACERINYFETNLDVPVYFKLRKILFQTISDLERKHLKAEKRDAYKEMYIEDEANCSVAQLNWNMFANSITSPSLRITRAERHHMLANVLNSISKNDKQIIELRHFDGMSNNECADVLKITPKNASIRYVRALQHLKAALSKYSEFSL